MAGISSCPESVTTGDGVLDTVRWTSGWWQRARFGNSSGRGAARLPEGERKPDQEYDHDDGSVEEVDVAAGDHERHPDHGDRATDVAHPSQAGAVGAEQDEPRSEVEHDAHATRQREQDEREAHPQGVEAEAIGDVAGNAEDHPIGRVVDQLGPRRRVAVVACGRLGIDDGRGCIHGADGTEPARPCTSGMTPIRP